MKTPETPLQAEPDLPPAVGRALDSWKVWSRRAELWWTRHGGVPGADVAERRLSDLIAFARERSPFYRERYAALPRGHLPLSCLPVVDKKALMARFDDWCTDREVRRDEVERFLADRSHIGDRFLGRYHVWKSSGTSGTPGYFVQDPGAMATYDALVAAQLDRRAQTLSRLFASGRRAALVTATGDHFASITMWEHARHVHPEFATRSYSVLMPLPRLVRELNAFQPVFLSSYPSVLALLAGEQRSGRLHIAPALAWSGGETLGAETQASIEHAFACPLLNEYGASECLSIARSCPEGWLHVNQEWVMLEGVDDAGKPTPPGKLSHRTLLTNLANRVQPVIRYDIGDRIVARDGPCPCGSRAPAVRVAGRADDLLRLHTPGGRVVTLVPLAVATAVEEAAGAHRIQVAQVAPDALALRLDGHDPALSRGTAGKRATQALLAYLATQGLSSTRVRLERRPPQPDARSGKLRAVIAL